MLVFEVLLISSFCTRSIESFVPISVSHTEFDHKRVGPPVTYKELRPFRVPNNFAAPTVPQVWAQGAPRKETNDEAFRPYVRLYSTDTPSKSRDSVAAKKPSITFEAESKSLSVNETLRLQENEETSEEGEDGFVPSMPLSQQAYRTAQRRDFGVSVVPINPLFQSYVDYNNVETLQNKYKFESGMVENEGYGVTAKPLLYGGAPYNIKTSMPEGFPLRNKSPLPYNYGLYDDWTDYSENPKKEQKPSGAKNSAYGQRINSLKYFPDPISDKNKEPEKNNAFPEMSLMFLGKHGPAFPVFTKMAADLQHTMESMVWDPTSIFRGDSGFYDRMKGYLDELTAVPYGDNKLDVFDFIPLVAVLVAAALILSGTFPNGLNFFGLNQSNLVFGRQSDEESIFERALNNLESGVMMISALRREESCSAKLACKFGDVARESFPNKGVLPSVVNFIVGNKFGNFSKSFEDVVQNRDRSSCEVECTQCIKL